MRFKEIRERRAWRVGFSAVAFAAAFVIAEYVEFGIFLWSSDDNVAASVMLVMTPLILAGLLGWFSRSAFSVVMLVPAFWLLYSAMGGCSERLDHADCIPTGPEPQYLWMLGLSLAIGWVIGYVLSFARTSATATS